MKKMYMLKRKYKYFNSKKLFLLDKKIEIRPKDMIVLN